MLCSPVICYGSMTVSIYYIDWDGKPPVGWGKWNWSVKCWNVIMSLVELIDIALSELVCYNRMVGLACVMEVLIVFTVREEDNRMCN